MPRSLSTVAVAEMFAQDVGVAYLILVTISHPSLMDSLRVSSDSVNTISRNNTFIAYPFNVNMPNDSPDAPPKTSISIDNISREITDALRSLVDPASVTIECVRSAAPDVVEFSYEDFILTNVKGDVMRLTGDLGVDDITTKPFPAKTFNPAQFPGLIS